MLSLAIPHLSGPLADLLAGPFGLVLLLVTLALVVVGGWVWETGPPWFTRRVMLWWRFGLVPVLVLACAVTTVVRLFALA